MVVHVSDNFNKTYVLNVVLLEYINLFQFKTDDRATESNRHLSSNLHEQHACHGPLQPDTQRACLPSSFLVREPWIHHQQQEISAISYSEAVA